MDSAKKTFNGSELSVEIDVFIANQNFASKIIELIRDTSDHDYGFFEADEFRVDVQTQEKYLKELGKKENSVMLLASDRQQLIGYVSVLGGNFRRNAHCGRLSISIKSKYHRCGVGGLLMRKVIEWVLSTGRIKRLELEVFETNIAGKRFFHRYGFRKEGVRVGAAQIKNVPVDVVMMGRNIK